MDNDYVRTLEDELDFMYKEHPCCADSSLARALREKLKLRRALYREDDNSEKVSD